MKKIYFFIAICTIQFFFAQDNSIDVKLNVYNFSASGNPAYLTELNGDILFSGKRPVENGGNELWLYNKNSNKSSVIKNYNQSNSNYYDRIKGNIVKFKGKTYFIATENADLNNQLWESDGTKEGTKLVKYLYNSSGVYSYEGCFVANDKLFLITDYQLWSSDGTANGTQPIAEVNFSNKYYAVNGKLYYLQNTYNQDILMVSDGTLAGTKPFKTYEKASPEYNILNNRMIVSDDNLFYVAKENGVKYLWKTDGTEEGTKRILPVDLTTLNGESIDNKIIYYDQNNNLWSSDGTLENTAVFKTLTSNIQTSFKYKNHFYLDTTENFWKTDGTEVNTAPITFTAIDKDLDYYTQSSEKNFLFLKSAIQYKSDVWMFNENKTLSKKLEYAQSYSLPEDYLEIENNIFFAGYSDLTGKELYKYDLHDDKESLVSDINFTYSSNPAAYTAIGDNLFFTAVTNNLSRKQIFKKNLITGVTAQVSNFATDPGWANYALQVGSYYYAYDYSYNQGFYKSDGTTSNSSIITTGAIIDFFNFNDHAVIYIMRTNSKLSVYKLENDSNEPILLKEQATNTYLDSGKGGMVNGELYFVFLDNNNHLSIWKTDGTPENTVKSIQFPYDNLQKLKIMGTVDSKLIFYKYTGAVYNQYNLYSSDGSEAGTILLKNLTASPADQTINYKNKLYFITGNTLSATDGTIAGTQNISEIGNYTYYGLKFKNCGKNLYAMLDNSLWRTDGTSTGTMIIAPNMNPLEMVCHKDFLYTATFETGRLFRTDGYRSKNIYIAVNVAENNTQVNEQHQVLSPSFKNLYSDGKTIYFTGYGNKTDYHQYEVLTELPQYLATNEGIDLNKKFNIQIYPNPSVSEINVKTTNGEVIKKIEIIDVSGKLVLTSLSEKNIDISKLSQSLYFVKIYTESEIYTTKLLKK